MQLKLFSASISKSLRVGHRRKINPIAKQNLAVSASWNLWTQEVSDETEMALLFLDIRNFTPLVEAHLPQAVVHFVKKLFISFQNIIKSHHGRIVETSGDGFYAAFGFNRGIKDATNDAVQSGFSILQKLNDLNNTSFEKNLRRKIDVGIGVHAGKVATGTIRLGDENHLVVMGYPVNIASRLQAATKTLDNNFIVSSTVYKQLDSRPTSTTVSDVTLKGTSDKFTLHLLGEPYTQNGEEETQYCID